MRLDPRAPDPDTRERDQRAISQRGFLDAGVQAERRQPNAEPAAERRQRERQYETIVEPIGEHEVREGGRQQVAVPVLLQHVEAEFHVAELDREDEAREIEYVIEREGGRFGALRRVRAAARKRVPQTAGEHRCQWYEDCRVA